MTKFLKFLSIFGPGRHAMSVGSKMDVLGVLTSGGRVNVSRFGNHRSNEWELRHGRSSAIHAARDQKKEKNRLSLLKID
jgi:hypothetical protein